MPSKELVSAVAKAIYEKRNGRGCKPWSYQTMSHQQPYLDDAQAALSTILAALQEPTEGMLKEAHKAEDESAVHNYGSLPSATDYWDFMLAASALGEQRE